MMVTFTDRRGDTRRVEIVEGVRLSGYRATASRYDDVRGALLKLWRDGHVGRTHTAITANCAPQALRGSSHRRGNPADVHRYASVDSPISNVAGAKPEPRLYVAQAEWISEAAAILQSFRPTGEFETRDERLARRAKLHQQREEAKAKLNQLGRQ